MQFVVMATRLSFCLFFFFVLSWPLFFADTGDIDVGNDRDNGNDNVGSRIIGFKDGLVDLMRICIDFYLSLTSLIFHFISYLKKKKDSKLW